jgi:uncharacterized membrane protein YfcA
MAANVSIPLATALVFQDRVIWSLTAGIVAGLIVGCVLGRAYEITKRVEGTQ